MRTLLAVFVLVFSTPAHAEAPMPDWLGGAWLSCADGEEVSEVWTGAGSGLLAGVNHTRRARGVAFEFMRIARDGDAVVFYASPGGAPPTAFRMSAHTAQSATFENAAHDFPQRVIYTRQGRDLTGRIEGQIDGKAESMTWRFRPARVGERCR